MLLCVRYCHHEGVRAGQEVSRAVFKQLLPGWQRWGEGTQGLIRLDQIMCEGPELSLVHLFDRASVGGVNFVRESSQKRGQSKGVHSGG